MQARWSRICCVPEGDFELPILLSLFAECWDIAMGYHVQFRKTFLKLWFKQCYAIIYSEKSGVTLHISAWITLSENPGLSML